MQSQKVFHNWLVQHLKARLSSDYSPIQVNLDGEKNNEFQGTYPDLILSNHGFVMAVMEVETEGSITPEKARQWKEVHDRCAGTKLILMVPQRSKAQVTELLWNEGIASNVAVGTYNLQITMP